MVEGFENEKVRALLMDDNLVEWLSLPLLIVRAG